MTGWMSGSTKQIQESFAQMTKKELFSLLKTLFDCYNIELKKSVAETWYRILQNYEYIEVKKAIVQMINSDLNRFEISASKIIQEIKTLKDPVIPEYEAKEDILSAVLRYGVYSRPRFKTKIAHAIVQDIGWKNLCTMKEKDVGSAIHFAYRNVYNSIDSGLELKLGVINGIIDQDNSRGKVENLFGGLLEVDND